MKEGRKVWCSPIVGSHGGRGESIMLVRGEGEQHHAEEGRRREPNWGLDDERKATLKEVFSEVELGNRPRWRHE